MDIFLDDPVNLDSSEKRRELCICIAAEAIDQTGDYIMSDERYSDDSNP